MFPGLSIASVIRYAGSSRKIYDFLISTTSTDPSSPLSSSSSSSSEEIMMVLFLKAVGARFAILLGAAEEDDEDAELVEAMDCRKLSQIYKNTRFGDVPQRLVVTFCQIRDRDCYRP